MRLAAGRLHGGGSVLEVQTVLPPDRGGGHLLFQDLKRSYTNQVRWSLGVQSVQLAWRRSARVG